MPRNYPNKDEFPNEIDLGRTETVTMPDKAEMASTSDAPAKTKKRKFYPTLYINGVDGLGDLPKEGYALIYFKRKNLSINEGQSGGLGPVSSGEEGGEDKTSYSADLEIQELCLPSDGEDADTEDTIDSLAEKAGIKTGRKSKKPMGDESDGEDDEDGEEGYED